MTSTETPSSEMKRMEALEPLLTVQGVCDVLGVSKPTLYRIIRVGELVPIRVSRSPRFAPADVRAYLERHREPVP